jgi:hypothetical protein
MPSWICWQPQHHPPSGIRSKAQFRVPPCARRHDFCQTAIAVTLRALENSMNFRGLTNPLTPLGGASLASARHSAPGARLVRKTGAMILAALALAGIWCCPAKAENPDISSRRASERVAFTDDEIKDGFLKIAFSAELQFDAPEERLRKFDDPVRIFVVSNAVPDRRSEIAAIVDDIRARVHHLDVAITNDALAANFTVILVADRDLRRTIRARYGNDKAKRIQQSLAPQCLSGIGKDARFRIRRAEVILPVDAGEFTFYDCAYEEMLQALGAINDDRSVPWTMFNDDVQMGFFDLYDQYLLNILYDPRVRPGMTKEEVNALLPKVLPTVRAWVNITNSAHHAGAPDGAGKNPTPAMTAALRRSVNPQTSHENLAN